jgi:hypothetical protein
MTPAEEGARLREAMDVYPDVADPDGTSTVHWIEIGPTGVTGDGISCAVLPGPGPPRALADTGRQASLSLVHH